MQEIRIGWNYVILKIALPSEVTKIQRPKFTVPVVTHADFKHTTPPQASNIWKGIFNTIQIMVPEDVLSEKQILEYTSKGLKLGIEYFYNKEKPKNPNLSYIDAKTNQLVLMDKENVYIVIIEDMVSRTNLYELNKVFTTNFNISIKFDILNLPNGVLNWIGTLAGSVNQKYPVLFGGEAIICAKEENKWAGMRIKK